MTQLERQARAAHESGHAVIAWLMGVRVSKVDLNECNFSLSPAAPANALIGVAGAVAEFLCGIDPNGCEMSDSDDRVARPDFYMAGGLLDAKRYGRRLVSRAMELLRANWSAFNRLREALFDAGSLTAGEIEMYLREPKHIRCCILR